MTMNPHIFRAYDIRGKVEMDITEETALLVGKAFGSVLRERYNIEHPRVLTGHDARLSSPALEASLAEGLQSTGCRVLRMGETPSPLNYFTICTQRLDGSVQVTASHNPATDNGFKLQMRDAASFFGDDLTKLYERITARKFVTGEGSMETMDAATPYLAHLDALFANAGQGLRVAVDSGNGVAGPLYCKALRQAGCALTELYTEPDGRFPNHAADPSKHATLRELQDTVRQGKADIGFGFDGDGDRLGVVDETGAIRSSDDVLLLLAQDLLQRHPGAAVVFTVSNSSILESEIAHWGGVPVMTKVGHSFVEHAMEEHGALLGGEQSGHFFCREKYFPFDDALAAALRILTILKSVGMPLSKRLAAFPRVYQAHELRPQCPDDRKAAVIAGVIEHFSKSHPVNTLDGARIDFGEGSWAGIRMSNTSPCLSICMEARTPEKLHKVQNAVLEHMKRYPDVRITE